VALPVEWTDRGTDNIWGSSMAVSSVSSNVPPAPPPQASAPPTPPPAKNDDDDRSVQAPKAPLPPGQGTRVDQLAW